MDYPTLVFDLQVINITWLSCVYKPVFINIQLEIPQLCILKDHHLIIEIIKSCNNLLLKLFSIYGIGASYEGHKGSQTCLIGYLHSVTIKFYYFKNWFSQATLFTKNKNKIIVFFYHCICLCILFSLDWKQQPNCTLIVKTQ